MKGKVFEQKHLNDEIDLLTIQLVEGDQQIITCPVDKLEEDFTGKYVSIYNAVTKLINANFGHEYPPGTIGTF